MASLVMKAGLIALSMLSSVSYALDSDPTAPLLVNLDSDTGSSEVVVGGLYRPYPIGATAGKNYLM